MLNKSASLIQKRDSLIEEYKKLKLILRDNEHTIETVIHQVKNETSQLKQIFSNAIPQIQTRLKERSSQDLNSISFIQLKTTRDQELQTEQNEDTELQYNMHNLLSLKNAIDNEISEFINLQLISEAEVEDINTEFQSLRKEKKDLDSKLKLTEKSLQKKQQEIAWLEEEYKLLMQHISNEGVTISIPAYMKDYLNSSI